MYCNVTKFLNNVKTSFFHKIKIKILEYAIDNIILKPIKSMIYSSQDKHTSQLDFCNRLADGRKIGCD